MRFLGVDPGLDGGFAFLSAEGLRIGRLPMVGIVRNREDRREFDDEAYFEILQHEKPDILLIENVGGIKGQAAGGSFTFGDVCGALRCAWRVYARLNGLGRETFNKVSPIVWRAKMRVRRECVTKNVDNKTGSRLVASRLYPQYAEFWKAAGEDGTAEAALIATYAKLYGFAK